MLYLIHKRNHPDLTYQGGQEPIVHLEADLHHSVDWARRNNRRWAFTTSNAGSYSFEDYGDLQELHRIDWDAVRTHYWQGPAQHWKQAEFLMEKCFPWPLIECVAVHSIGYYNAVQRIMSTLPQNTYRPAIEIHSDWYY